MIGIARDIARVAAFHSADGVGEAVPDGFAFAVFVPATLNLISRGGCAKNEFFRELERSKLYLRLKQFARKPRARGQNIERGGSTERSAQEIATIQIAPPAHEILLDNSSGNLMRCFLLVAK